MARPRSTTHTNLSANAAVDLPQAARDAAGAFVTRDGHHLLIEGRWVPVRSGETFGIADPATGPTVAHAAADGPEDVDAAVRAARRAFQDLSWLSMAPRERGALLMTRMADLIEENADDLTLIQAAACPPPLSRQSAYATARISNSCSGKAR